MAKVLSPGSVDPIPLGAAARALRVAANGLEHHVLEWESSRSATPSPTVVLVHGFMDAAGTWDLVAPILAGRGFRVLAPDMRGFGDGARAPQGSYYHFSDYVADLAELVEELAPGERVSLIGHSMGGTICTLYAGTFPERVARLVSVEGLGPPDNPWEVGPTRMRRWVHEVRAARERGEAAPFKREEALRRLVLQHSGIPREVLVHRLPHLVREVAGGDDVVWSFDPLHRTMSPVPFFAKLFVEFARLITCPVLFVSGGVEGFHPADEEARLASFADLERVTFDGAGHMVHWTRPTELAGALLAFL